MGGRVFRNYYKGHIDKTTGEGGRKGGKWVWLGWVKGVGRKCRHLCLNNNEIIKIEGEKRVNSFHCMEKKTLHL